MPQERNDTLSQPTNKGKIDLNCSGYHIRNHGGQKKVT